jgi:hypothetical protein
MPVDRENGTVVGGELSLPSTCVTHIPDLKQT